MRDVGLSATEFGPAGFLPDDPGDKARLLQSYGLAAVGGFVPVVLHEAMHDPLPVVDQVLDSFVAAGASTLVLAAATGRAGYDERPALDGAAWKTLLTNLDRLAELADRRGVRATLHPHVGTIVESPSDVRRVLDGSSIALCLDTGHLLIGGTDPGELATAAAARIAHTHLKDVDGSLAVRVRDGDLSYAQAVRVGLFRPLGQGDVDIAGIVRALESSGYAGWYVMEQDAVLSAEPIDSGPVKDVQMSVDFLRGLA